MILSLEQAALFRARVDSLSKGRVSVPDCELSRQSAVGLWTDIVLVFAKDRGSSRALRRREADELVAKARFRSGGRVELSGLSLSLEQGLAAWRVAIFVGDLKSAAGFSRAGVREAKLALVAGAALSLAACTTMFGGNIKGNFACSAPGGTCAPSTAIDDQALSVIQNARPMTPAGPYIQPLRGNGGPQTALAPVGDGRVAVAGNGSLHRDRRVLRVVFPSYVDGKGNLHEARVVHTVTDNGGWMQLSSGEANVGEQAVGRADARVRAEVSTGLQSAAVPGQAGQLLASGPEVGSFSLAPGQRAGDPAGLAAPGLKPVGPVLSGLPSAEAVDAARRRGPRPAGNPLDAIKARVAVQLGQGTGAGEGSAAAAPVPDPKPAAAAAPVAAAGQDSAIKGDAPPRVVNAPSVFPVKVEE